MRTHEWSVYAPDDGHWPIPYDGFYFSEARIAYLEWAGRKRLPAGGFICLDWGLGPVSVNT